MVEMTRKWKGLRIGEWNRLPGEEDTRVTFLLGAIFSRGRVYRSLNHPRAQLFKAVLSAK